MTQEHTRALGDGLNDARKEWWNAVCRQGDPIRRPNLAWEAFEAGWQARVSAPVGDVTEEVEVAVARALHFDFVDQHGYPNGLPTWDELPETTERRIAADVHAREFWRSLACAAITALLSHRSAAVGDVTGFLDAIMARTPKGEWIAVQYHPDGDWSVAHEPLSMLFKDRLKTARNQIVAFATGPAISVQAAEQAVADIDALLSHKEMDNGRS